MKKSTWRAPRPHSQRNYPMNCWWVAALSTDALLAATLQDKNNLRAIMKGGVFHKAPTIH